MTNRGRYVTTGAVFVVAFAVSAWICATIQNIRPLSNTVRSTVAQTVASRGIEAGVARYRHLREHGFRQFSESEADTNDLGYTLLRKGDTAAAIAIFRLNVETHPASSNVYDSLAEAYADAGDKKRAIVYYRTALTIDPDKKSAGLALAVLTGTPRKPYGPTILVHLGAGLLGILFGASALAFRKGLPRHRWSGNLSSLGMLIVACAGMFLGIEKAQPSNALAGAFTLYLIATGWYAAKRRNGKASLFDWIALAVGAGIVAGFTLNAFEAIRDGDGLAVVFVVFGVVAFLAAVSDARILGASGLIGPQRLRRHLWRSCFALVIIVSSFFGGQTHLFPEIVRKSGLLAVPTVVVLAVMLFWLWRVRRPSTAKRIAIS